MRKALALISIAAQLLALGPFPAWAGPGTGLAPQSLQVTPDAVVGVSAGQPNSPGLEARDEPQIPYVFRVGDRLIVASLDQPPLQTHAAQDGQSPLVLPGQILAARTLISLPAHLDQATRLASTQNPFTAKPVEVPLMDYQSSIAGEKATGALRLPDQTREQTGPDAHPLIAGLRELHEHFRAPLEAQDLSQALTRLMQYGHLFDYSLAPRPGARDALLLVPEAPPLFVVTGNSVTRLRWPPAAAETPPVREPPAPAASSRLLGVVRALAPLRATLLGLSLAVAGTALGVAAMAFAPLHHGPWTDVAGWTGAATLIGLTTVEIAEVLKDQARLRRGGEEGLKADQELAGVDTSRHGVLMGGKMLQWFPVAYSGSLPLIANILVRTGLSWAVMALLVRSGHMDRRKFALVTGGVLALLALTPFLGPVPSLIAALGAVGATIYALFTLPTYFSNKLKFLRIINPTSHKEIYENFTRLAKNRYWFHALMALGNLLLMFEYWAHGQLPNAGATLFAGLISAFTIVGMYFSGLFPLLRSTFVVPGGRSPRVRTAKTG